MILAPLVLELLKSGVVGSVAEEVVASLIVEDLAHAAGDVIGIVHEQTARLLRQIVQSVLGLKVILMTLLLYSRQTRTGQHLSSLWIVFGGQAEGWQSAGIDAVDHHRGAVGGVGQLAHLFQDDVVETLLV